jgi:hypothetical protein
MMNDGKKSSALLQLRNVLAFTLGENSAFVHKVVKNTVAVNLSVFTP